MCGLFGQLTYDSAAAPSPTPDVLRAIAALATRRGPDDEGLWSDGWHCTLAFRRLSVFDLSTAGHQPMLSADGRHAIVYNGALYNFRELRAELESTGARFRSSSDTEVVLNALVTWGTAALARFNGMFALALYDTRERRVLLARDHAGMKPLYFARATGGLIFASQFDQIMAHPWISSADCSADALALYLRLGYVPAPYAPLQGTHALTPGSWLEIDGRGRERHGRFFEFPRERVPDLRGEAADEAVRAAVTAAVKRHLAGDVPVGAFLSGGVDSPLVAATMAALVNAPIPAFTLSTGGDELDESGDAASYAREIGAAHFIGELTPQRARDMLDDVVAACGEPSADYSIFPTMFVSALARERVKVALTGDGGDELFWGYVGRVSAVLRRVEAENRKPTADAGGLSWARVLALGRAQEDPRWPRSIGDLQRLSHTHAAEGWLRQVFPGLPPWPAEFGPFEYNSSDVEETARWLRWNELTAYLPIILQKVDRGSMFHSLEVRSPLLDREVIDVASRVDWRTCLDLGQRVGKLPLRRALAKLVRRQTSAKRGFTVPMSAWLRGPLRDVFADTVLSRDSIAGLALHPAPIRERFERHLAGEDHGWHLWVLLSLALWEQHYR